MLSHNKRLMEARLGVYEKPTYIENSLTDEMSDRLSVEGGYRQQERMITAKRKTFERALLNSYQAAEITAVQQQHKDAIETNLTEDTFSIQGHVCGDIVVYVDPIDNVAYVNKKTPEAVVGDKARALINPNVTKPDYDDKVLSVGYEYNYAPGDIFYWDNTKTYWLIYLQDLTELAYFKGDIRKCNYQVKWKDAEGAIHSTWFAVRGPVETKINYLQKSGVAINTPNHTLSIMMPKTPDTLAYFQRYSKFYLNGIDELTNKICWRVEATDTISMPGVLEITAMEYYSNESQDKDGIVGGAIETPPEVEESLIIGDSTIRPRTEYKYSYAGQEVGQWQVESLVSVEIRVEGKDIFICWPYTYSGTITLKYGAETKDISVKSLF